MERLISVFFILGLLAFNFTVFAETRPTPFSTDPRVQSVRYQENQIYLLQGAHLYNTTIQLNPDERIETIDLGDSSAWTVNAGVNSLTLKPRVDFADTNMTIRTDKRLYLFQLTTTPLRRDSDGVPIFEKPKNAVYLLRFDYQQPIWSLGETRTSSLGIVMPPTKVKNSYYSARGDETLLPRAVYDDGKFTYFDYTNIMPIPQIYSVNSSRRESILNKRMEEGWVVVESLAKQFTLRYGEQTASVFNDITIARK